MVKASFITLFSTCCLILPSCVPGSGDEEPADPAFQVPQLQFSPLTNGRFTPLSLIDARDAYHLFYHLQDTDTNSFLGHAVSPDLFHWEDLPPFAFADLSDHFSTGYIIPGSPNDSDAAYNPEKDLILFYILKAKNIPSLSVEMAVSHDRGLSWKKHIQSPSFNGKPPGLSQGIHVSRNNETGSWIMILTGNGRVDFYGSEDLTRWEYLSSFHPAWTGTSPTLETPAFFAVRPAGQQEMKWILWANTGGGENTGIRYFIGHFDGRRFIRDENAVPENGLLLDQGSCISHGITCSMLDEDPYRRIMISQAGIQEERGALPRELVLGMTASGLRLLPQPAEGLSDLRQITFNLDSNLLSGTMDLSDRIGFRPDYLEILLEMEIPENEMPVAGIAFTDSLGNRFRSGYDASGDIFFSEMKYSTPGAEEIRHLAPRAQGGTQIRMQWICTPYGTELFADWGATCITECFPGEHRIDRIELFCEQGRTVVHAARFSLLKNKKSPVNQ